MRSFATRHCCHSALSCIASSFVFFCRELRLDSACEREIHVVAAEQDVFADGDTLEPKFATFLGDGDEREVGGAAADVDNEDQIADADLLAPVRMALDPGVESGLRLFEQDDVLIAGFFGSVQCQFAGHGVERGRDGNKDGLFLEADRPGARDSTRRECARDRRARPPTGEILPTPSGAVIGSSAEVRSTPPCDSHDFAEDTSRPAFSAPRFCASCPTTYDGASFHGRAMDPAGKSFGLGR